MSPSDKTFGCPACGMMVTGKERACPRCGRSFGDDLKFECPYCGEFIPRAAVKCPFCDLDVSKYSAEHPSPRVEKKLDDLLENLIEEEAVRVKGEAKTFSCPDCAWLLDGTEAKCPKCGLEFSDKVKIACPICGTSVGKDLVACPLCGAHLRPKSEAEPAPSPVAQPAVAPPPAIRAPVPSPAPSQAPEATVTKPGQGLRDRVRQQQDQSPRPAVPIPIEKPAPPPPRPAPAPAPAPVAQPEQKPTPVVPAPAPKPPPAVKGSPEAALGMLGEIARREASGSQLKQRKLKEGKVTSVAAARARTPGQGLSNGIGQVNGAGQGRINGSGRVNGRTNGTGRVNGRTEPTGKVNGSGAVNGRSLVNGTGVSNGLRSRPRSQRLGRAGFLLRWQFLAVLVAVMVIVPTFIYLSTRNHAPYSVDGDFADWSDVAKFGARTHTISQSINIQEWAVAQDGSDLFFFMRTGAAIMASGLVESVFLFIDSDGENDTGYSVDSLGAEFMILLDGWDGSVKAADLLGRSTGSDALDWGGWTSIGGVSVARGGYNLEAGAGLPSPIGPQSKFFLMTKDSLERSSSSYPMPRTGGLLIVRQEPSPDIADDGIIQTLNPASLLTLSFTCAGSGGSVQGVLPTVTGGVASALTGFSIEPGQRRTANVTCDLSTTPPGQVVSAVIKATGITSSFHDILIEGSEASGYARSAPANISIDGAFGDWIGKRLPDQDASPVTDQAIDINLTGNVSTASASYFYVSVKGEIWNGSFVPSERAKPSGEGGGAVIPQRKTGEDALIIYIDSDRSTSTGYLLSYGSKVIGADQKIEIKGLGGEITSSAVYYYTAGSWSASSEQIDAAKGDSEVELSIDTSAIGGSWDIDFIVETTSWKSVGDRATWTPTGMASIQTWPVTGSLTSPYATSMSYQRKIFYDGTNFWSFYYDGSNTAYRYSTDQGATWTLSGNVFKTSGVNETSVWYDSANSVVYAVGDSATASRNVTLQKGTVAPASHSINWASSDSTLASSANVLAGKNAFISRDANGYLWVVSSNYSTTSPKKYDLTAFKSTAANSIASFSFSGQMLTSSITVDTVKGAILPAGSGGDVWGVYTSSGALYARKFTGTWGGQTTISTAGGANAVHENSAPSVVVDARGVVHVVWGSSRSGNSPPTVKYSHNDTGATTFTAAADLDPWIPTDVGDFYPTASLETASGDVYAMWIRTDTGGVGRTVMMRKLTSGSWANVTLDPQTSYPKQYLTSIYSISGEFMVCWQWTQNTTGTIQVTFDHRVPEFSSVVLPVLASMLILFIAARSRSRRRD